MLHIGPCRMIQTKKEDGKLFVEFRNADVKPVARKEMPKDATVEAWLAKMGRN